MLIKYKKQHKKIAMGLLSLTPGKPDTSSLQMTMDAYEESPEWQLYLWKQEDDIVGAIGVNMQEHTFTVEHITVSPSFRNEGIGFSMVKKIQDLQEPLAMSSTVETKEFLGKCWEKQNAGKLNRQVEAIKKELQH